MSHVSAAEIADALRVLSLKDLRQQCRARGLNPAGGQEALKQRLSDNMQATKDVSILAVQEQTEEQGDDQMSKNNYQRPGGRQNLGNRLTNRPSSRVTAPPGGASQISFGDMDMPPPAAPVRQQQAPPPSLPTEMPDESQYEPAYENPMAAARAHDEGRVAMGAVGTAAQIVPSHVSQLAFGEYQLPSTVERNPPPQDPTAATSQAAQAAMQQDLLGRVDSVVKGLLLKDLRVQCRARGLSPAGGMEALRQRLGAHMMETGDLGLVAEGQEGAPTITPADRVAGASVGAIADGSLTNNYARPAGMQNVGNFITDRPSSRVLAPPGGVTQVGLALGGYAPPAAAPPPQRHVPSSPYGPPSSSPYAASPAKDPNSTAGASTADVKDGRLANNYSRPGGQNVGNFITDRPSSRVLAPPGGRSQISFG